MLRYLLKRKELIPQKKKNSFVFQKDSLCIILALVAHFDLEMQQIDMKTVFLNRDIEEEVYMKQPKGFFFSDGENLVYNLKKSMYILKEAS